jgi:hypothetical protein
LVGSDPGSADSVLAGVVAAWPTLTDRVRAAILSLLDDEPER